MGKIPSGSLTGLGTWLDEECKGEEGVQFKFGQVLEGVIGQPEEEQSSGEELTRLVLDPGDRNR